MPAYRGRVNAERRATLAPLQQHVCPICGGTLLGSSRDGKPSGFYSWSVEHVVPIGSGGPAWGYGNVLIAHRSCNQAKGVKPPTGCELIHLMAVNARLGPLATCWEFELVHSHMPAAGLLRAIQHHPFERIGVDTVGQYALSHGHGH